MSDTMDIPDEVLTLAKAAKDAHESSWLIIANAMREACAKRLESQAETCYELARQGNKDLPEGFASTLIIIGGNCTKNAELVRKVWGAEASKPKET